MKIKIKMLALDLDGTCLNSDHEISEKLKSFLKQIRNEVYVCLVTGRSLADAYRYQRYLELTSEIICNNGAVIYNSCSHKFENKYITNVTELLTYCINLFEGKKIDNIVLSRNENTYYLNKNNEHLYYMFYDEELPKYFINESDMKQIDGVQRIVLSVNPEILFQVKSDLEMRFGNISICTWHNRNDILDINILDSNKWDAIIRLAATKKIKPEEIMTIGDGDNDIEMLRNSGAGICMLNGTEGARNASNHITRYDNNNEGVLDFLENYIMNI